MPVTHDEVEKYDRMHPQLESLRTEMAVLSKPKPDGPINKFKLGHINNLLVDANTLLQGEYKPLKGFSQFDEAVLPTNSDVVFVLSQYLEALETWRSASVKNDAYKWVWDTKKPPVLEAEPPRRLR